jgi:hypothetical protein
LTFGRKQAAFLNRQVFLEYESIFASGNVLTHGIHCILGKKYGPHLSEFSSDLCAFSIEVEILNPKTDGFTQPTACRVEKFDQCPFTQRSCCCY